VSKWLLVLTGCSICAWSLSSPAGAVLAGSGVDAAVGRPLLAGAWENRRSGAHTPKDSSQGPCCRPDGWILTLLQTFRSAGFSAMLLQGWDLKSAQPQMRWGLTRTCLNQITCSPSMKRSGMESKRKKNCIRAVIQQVGQYFFEGRGSHENISKRAFRLDPFHLSAA
jgi:hypothetical protein